MDAVEVESSARFRGGAAPRRSEPEERKGRAGRRARERSDEGRGATRYPLFVPRAREPIVTGKLGAAVEGPFHFPKGARTVLLPLSLSPTRTWERGWWRQQLAMEGESGRHEIRPSTGRRDTRDVNTTRLRRRGRRKRRDERRGETRRDESAAVSDRERSVVSAVSIITTGLSFRSERFKPRMKLRIRLYPTAG